MRRLAPVALVLALVGLAGCRHDRLAAGEARLTDVSGRVEVRHAGVWRAADGGVLRRGDHVRVRGAASSAALELADGGRLELRGGTRVGVAPTPVLEAGDLLVLPGSRAINVAANGVAARVVGHGAARLSQTLAFESAAYAGTVRLSSAGRSLTVPALRQTGVPSLGLVPSQPAPLVYRDADRWDRRFLGRAIDLGRDLASRSRGVTGQLRAGEGTSAGFYRLLLPGLDSETAFTQTLVSSTGLPPGENLVGAAIALRGHRGTFASRWEEAFAFRDDGAEWGLVALDQQVRDTAGLVGDLDLALGRLGERLVAAPILPPPDFTGAVASSGGTPTTTPPSPSPSTVPTPPTTPPTQPPPSVPPPPPTGVEPVDQLVDPLVDTVNGLIAGLLGPPPPPGLTVDGASENP